MNYHKLLDIAFDKHKEQKRKNGSPYILHPLRVALRSVKGSIAKAKVCVAILHDIIEDTDMTLEQIKTSGIFDENSFYDDIKLPVERVYEALDILTHKEGETYQVYINRIRTSSNGIAISVKISDLLDNLYDVETMGERAEKMKERYLKALMELSNPYRY